VKDLGRASARGVVWNLVQNLSSRLISLLIVAVLGRMLDKSAFAAIALGLALGVFAEILMTGGYVEFIAQRPNLTNEHFDTAFMFNVGLGAALAGLTIAFAKPLAAAFSDESIAPIVRWLSLSLVIRSTCVVPMGILTREMNFRALSLRTLVASIVSGVAGLIAAFAGMGVYTLVLQVLLADFTATALLWHSTKWRPSWRFYPARFRELLDFGLPVIGASILNNAARRADTFIVGASLGLVPLGLYGMGQRVFQIATVILNKSSDAVVLSALARLADDHARRRQAFYTAVELTAVTCFPLYVGLAIAANPATIVLFSSRWTDSAVVLTLFALSGVPVSLSYLHSAAFKSTGYTRSYLVTQAAIVIIYIPLLIAVVGGGIEHAALAYLVSCVVVVPFEVWLLHAALSIDIRGYFVATFGPSLATAVMAAAMFGVAYKTEAMIPIARLGLELAAGAIAYPVALRLIAPTSYARCRSIVLGFRKKPEEGAATS